MLVNFLNAFGGGRGPQGAQGAAGAAGSQGAQGAQGAAGGGPFTEIPFTSGSKIHSPSDGVLAFEDSTGLANSSFLIGPQASAVRLKGDGGTLSVRNAADTDFLSIQCYELHSSQFVRAQTHFEVNGQQVVGARQGPISAPSGGATEDTEARTAISAIISVLQTHGLTS